MPLKIDEDEEKINKHYFMLSDIKTNAGGTCMEILAGLPATTDERGYVPQGPWKECLEAGVRYEHTHPAWSKDVRYQKIGDSDPQGPAGQVIDLFLEHVDKAQEQLEKCMHELQSKLVRESEAHSKPESTPVGFAERRAMAMVSNLQISMLQKH